MPLADRPEIFQLRNEVKQLKAQLAAIESPIAPDLKPEWSAPLNPQCTQLVFLLVKAYPRAITDEYIDDNIPHQDMMATRDRCQPKVLIHYIRKHLGCQIIKTERGIGYRASSELVKMVRG